MLLTVKKINYIVHQAKLVICGTNRKCICVLLCAKLIGSTKKDVKRRNIERKLFFDRANASAASHCLQSRLNAFRKRLSIRLIVIYFCKKYKTVNGGIDDRRPRGSCFIRLVYHVFLIEYGYKKGGRVRVDLFVINNIFKDLKKKTDFLFLLKYHRFHPADIITSEDEQITQCCWVRLEYR